MSDPRSPLLLYDGLCPLCSSTVRWILRLDRRRTIRFAPLQGPTAQAHLTAHPGLAHIDSIVLIHDDWATVRSAAVLGIVDYLGWPWKVLLLGRLMPRRLRDGLYDAVAARRKRVFGSYQSCPLPPASAQDRFLP